MNNTEGNPWFPSVTSFPSNSVTVKRSILAVTGFSAEARIARGPGVVVISGGGNRLVLGKRIEAALARGISAILSFGIAGALDPLLKPGACVVARNVIDEDAVWPVDAAWSDAIALKLGDAVRADLAGVDRVIDAVADKRGLFIRSGAASVDMESHIAARMAHGHGIPFATVRVISDSALTALPRSAARALRDDGSIDLISVMKSVLARPAELPLLWRAGMDARIAFRTLRRSRRRLGDALGFPDLDHLLLDVS
jgi:adenosylhomocysteine nucleosidase